VAIRIGKIELLGVQSLHTEETRTLVEQRVPEQQGSAFQDLGREPVTLVLEGFLHGDDAGSTLETLRTAQAKAEPQSFAADIVVGTELTDVIIESVRVRQLAGYRNRYRFQIRLREHVEPPQPAGAGAAAVSKQAKQDAAAWGGGQMAAGGVLQDPASLPAALAANPGVLDALDMNEMGGALARDMDVLSAGQLDGVLSAVANANPAKADALLGGLKEAGGLGSMLVKYASEGVAFLKGIDLKKLGALAKAFAGGLDFLQKLLAVVDTGSKLVATISQLQLPPKIAAQLTSPGKPAA
jgi:hypothetical protein